MILPASSVAVVPWWLVPLALFVGSMIGVLVAALCSAAGRTDERAEEYERGQRG